MPTELAVENCKFNNHAPLTFQELYFSALHKPDTVSVTNIYLYHFEMIEIVRHYLLPYL